MVQLKSLSVVRSPSETRRSEDVEDDDDDNDDGRRGRRSRWRPTSHISDPIREHCIERNLAAAAAAAPGDAFSNTEPREGELECGSK